MLLHGGFKTHSDPVADGEKDKTTSAIAAKVTPWLHETLQGYGAGMRRMESDLSSLSTC